MNITEYSLKKPVTVTMFYLAIILLGLISWAKLPQDLYPPITYPKITILTYYLNAAPVEMEQQITKPLEEAIGSVNNLKEIYSVSKEGTSIIIASFSWGTSMDFAALNVREKLDLVKDRLPKEAEDPLVIKFNPLEEPVMLLSVKGNRSPLELRNFVERRLKDDLEKIEGIASAGISGGLQREIRVEIDKGRLQASGLSLLSVIDNLKKANLNYPAGSIKGNLYEYLIRVVGEWQTVAEIAYTPVSAPAGRRIYRKDAKRIDQTEESPRDTLESERRDDEDKAIDATKREKSGRKLLLLKELCTITDGTREKTSVARFDNEDNISLVLQKQAGANTVQVVAAVREALENIRKELPEDITVTEVSDQATLIINSINGVRDAALQGGVLAFLVLLFFLRNFWSALFVTVAIPISIMATIVLMYFSGLTLNMMSLGGLALGVGMLVDNGIVVIENIFRHRSMGKTSEEAAVIGTNEVLQALISSTLTTVAVFLPLIFVSGVAGQLFKELAYTVSFSLISSLLVSLTVIPLLSSAIGITPGSVSSTTRESALKRFVAGLSNRIVPAPIMSFFQEPKVYYSKKGFIFLLLFSVLLLFVVSLTLFGFLDMELMPKVDQGSFIVNFALPKGTTLEKTDSVAHQIEDGLAAISEVKNVTVTIGSEKGGSIVSALKSRGTHEGETFITLKKERDRSTAEIIQTLKEYLQPHLPSDVVIEYNSRENPLGSLFGGGAPIVVQIKGMNLETLRDLSRKTEHGLTTIPGIYGIKNSLSESIPETQIHVYKDKASLYSLSVREVALAANSAIQGIIATKFKDEYGKEIGVRVLLREEDRQDFDSIGDLLIHSQNLRTDIALRQVASVSKGIGFEEVNRHDQERVVNVTANIFGRDKKDVMSNVTAMLGRMDVPGGYRAQLIGESQEMKESFQSLAFALALSILLVYMIMASQFESLLQPFVIMFTVPLSVIGIAWILFLTDTSVNVVGLLGVIMLGGIVVNNGIILIEYINLTRSEGADIVTAAVNASRIRLRPILMSALTTVFGLCPMALGIGEGNEMRAPMAITVMGGLGTSTFLTLVVLPGVYILAENLFRKAKILKFSRKSKAERLREKIRKRLAVSSSRKIQSDHAPDERIF